MRRARRDLASFWDAELNYLNGERRLGRLATADADGLPHVVPPAAPLTTTPRYLGSRRAAATHSSSSSRPMKGHESCGTMSLERPLITGQSLLQRSRTRSLGRTLPRK